MFQRGNIHTWRPHFFEFLIPSPTCCIWYWFAKCNSRNLPYMVFWAIPSSHPLQTSYMYPSSQGGCRSEYDLLWMKRNRIVVPNQCWREKLAMKLDSYTHEWSKFVDGCNAGSGSIGYDPNLYQVLNRSLIIRYHQKLNLAGQLFSWREECSWTNGKFEQKSVTAFCQVFLRCLQGNKFALSTLMAVSTLKITEIFSKRRL